jgi:hypothetical protein
LDWVVWEHHLLDSGANLVLAHWALSFQVQV